MQLVLSKRRSPEQLTGNCEEDTALIPSRSRIAAKKLWERLPLWQGERIQAMDLNCDLVS